MTKQKKFYITTPIYYVNDKPHIGHSYTTVLADVINRYHKLLGNETFFLTGTDEHGQKVKQAAEKRNIDPQTHVDEYNERFKELWASLKIEYNKFIRTTNPEHKKIVQDRLSQLYDKGDIFTKTYAGWYSVSEERFFTKDELIDGKDPISGKIVEWIEEKNYFFKMSKYKDQLLKHINDNPDFILPNFRKNEVLGFLKKELNDLCISRPASRLNWGIPLPFDGDYVTYVWFDALLNYLSAVTDITYSDNIPIWPATYHLIGKDILTTHCVYWTTMLFAMDIPLPKHILAHGWWLNAGAKMSKSSGTAVDPIPYIKKYGYNSFRYFLMSEMVIGQDASFSDDFFIKRLNSDLSNDLGNCINRVYKLILKHFDGKVPSPKTYKIESDGLKVFACKVIDDTIPLIESTHISQALSNIFLLIRKVNKYIDKNAPWQLSKDPDKRDSLADVLFSSAEALRISLTLLQPVIPGKAKQGLKIFGVTSCKKEDLKWGGLKGDETITPAEPLFPRIEVKKKKDAVKSTKISDPITALELRVGEIVDVIPHPDADSLFAMKVNIGSEINSICAGIRISYKTDELLNRKVVILANLKPAKLRGIESKGMVLAGNDKNNLPKLIDPGDLPVGTLLKFGDKEPSPKAKLTIKDFAKVELIINKGNVFCDKLPLHYKDNNIKCDVPDNAKVQ